jgi:hypothetical protein
MAAEHNTKRVWPSSETHLKIPVCVCVCVSLLNYCTEKSIPCRYAENIYSANW